MLTLVRITLLAIDLTQLIQLDDEVYLHEQGKLCEIYEQALCPVVYCIGQI